MPTHAGSPRIRCDNREPHGLSSPEVTYIATLERESEREGEIAMLLIERGEKLFLWLGHHSASLPPFRFTGARRRLRATCTNLVEIQKLRPFHLSQRRRNRKRVQRARRRVPTVMHPKGLNRKSTYLPSATSTDLKMNSGE